LKTFTPSGHVAGVVNPPVAKKYGHWTGAETLPDAPEAWLAGATQHPGSWWEDWTAWSESRAGELIKPPHMGSRKHPAIADAPGEYVFG